MCSILGIFDLKKDAEDYRVQAIQMSKKLRHRGPDWSGIYCNKNAVLVHERLSIVDIDSGEQPLYNIEKTNILAVNGEIYNHKELELKLKTNFKFQTKSDCEIILALYKEKGVNFLDDLNGMFAFCLYDEIEDAYLIGRDHMGIIPLYIGYDMFGSLFVASEMKALTEYCAIIEEFPAGHYLWSKDRTFTKYYERDWLSYESVKDNDANIETLRQGLEDAVHRQLMCDVPYGVLLSGGLDSSLISAITQKFSQKRIEENDKSKAWWPQVHSFSVGLEGSPDLKAAQDVANMIGTIHHPVIFTVQQGIDAIREVIYHLETYDVTTIRASIPMYLMSRKIKSMGIKMVLSGEGSDELFGGYLYFHKAPNDKEFHEELNRKLSKLHLFDCLRANKSMAAWGVEARVPFLDKEFMDIAMRINPKAKECKDGKIEKHILREAFDGKINLPKEVLWRQKEQFSDGVGYTWIDSLKEYTRNNISDNMMESAGLKFPINTPDTKEAYYYRMIFENNFPQESQIKCVPHGKSVACSTVEALAWDESFSKNADPSGRASKIHNSTLS